jgi:nicotinate-nucleotide pyrophosphorylase (carboxylating)
MMTHQEHVYHDVTEALKEDIGTGDVTAALIPHDVIAEGLLYAREPFFLAGVDWFNEAFIHIDKAVSIDWQYQEGTFIETNQPIAIVKGRASSLLTAERTALNYLQLISGTATKTAHLVQQLKPYRTQLLDTRKTIPQCRYAQKYATKLAGATNHRMGLYDAFLIKENHIKACGGIDKAILTARALYPHLFLEIEVETLDELRLALVYSPDRIMLDNFSLEDMQIAITFPRSKTVFEVSGNVTGANLIDIAKTGVEYISMGALTKSVTAIDFSFLI